MPKITNFDVERLTSANLQPARAKWAVLAAMRFFLAMVVMFSHFGLFGFGGDYRALLRTFSGKAAVLGFFLISGYSIAHSLHRSPVGFYRRRFLRIYPLYFLSVLFSEALILCLGRVTVGNTQFVGAGIFTCIGNVLLLQGFLCINITFNGSLWSLAVEWFYYLLAPLLTRIRPILLVVSILSATAYLSRWGFSKPVLYGYAAFMYCWAWLLGFMLYGSRNDWRIIFLILTGTIISMYGLEPGSIVFTLPYICAAIGIIASWNIDIPGWLEKSMTHLGDLSYPVYLFHFPIMILVSGKFHINSWIWMTVICLIASEVLFQTVDVQLKKRVLSPLILGFNRKINSNRPAL